MARKKSLNYFVGKKYDNVMARYYRETDTSYKNYGKVGIRVCSDWIKDINNFKNWFISELFKNGISESEFTKKQSQLSN